MAGEWPIRRLAEVCDSVDYGYTASAKDIPCGPKFLRITDIVSGWVDWSSVPYCEIDESAISKYRLDHGDVVIARTGATTGYSAYIAEPPDAVFASYLVRLKAGQDADPRFISYFLKSPRFWRYMHGVLGDKSAQPNASATTMTQVMLPLPPLEEQQAIAHILGTLDDKIELNRRMNQTLETMAQAIFKCWFVDFDPVHAKAAGEQPPGLAPHIADLFPDSFEESELGEIPKGWDVVSVGDVCEFAYGKALKASLRKPGEVPVMGSNGQIGWHDTPLVAGPGIVVGRKGNPGVVTWVDDSFFPIDTTFYVVPRLTWVPLTYLHYALIDLDLPRLSADSAVPGLNRNIAYMSRLLLPFCETLEAFAHYTRLLKARMHQGEQENRTLAALRDAFLPRLISGELRVPDAERFVGRCV